MTMRDWATLIETHQGTYEASERRELDKAVNYYNGRFYGEKSHTDREAGRLAYNLVYTVVETAVAQLVPSNPKVSPEPEGPVAPQLVRDADSVTNRVLKLSRIRREAVMAITNAVLKKRGVFKTTWSGTGRAVVRSISPEALWFDLSAKAYRGLPVFHRVHSDAAQYGAGQDEAQGRSKVPLQEARGDRRQLPQVASPGEHPRGPTQAPGRRGVGHHLRGVRHRSRRGLSPRQRRP